MVILMKNIIIVDMQKGFINDHNKDLVEKINNYLASNKFDHVFYTKYINYKGSPFIEFLDWTDLQDKESQEIAVNIVKGATIIDKLGYGLDQKGIDIIKNTGISECEVVGTNSDACVLAVGFNLFDNGIKPIFLKDMIGTNGKLFLNDYAYAIFDAVFTKGDE